MEINNNEKYAIYSDTQEEKKITEYLDGLEHNLMGQPIFRLVWADEQFEYREGDFNEFHGTMFLRTISGVKKTPKYPQLKGLWILEQWFNPERLQTKEIKEHNGYECFYSFRDNKFNRLPLRLRVVELIMKAKHKYRKSNMLSKSTLQKSIDDKEEKMDKFTYDAIDPSSPIESALHFGEGVSYHGLDIPLINEK